MHHRLRATWLAGLWLLLAGLPCQSQTPPQAATDANSTTQSPPNKAGTVSLVEGEVRFYKPDKSAVRPSVGTAIYERDSIVTGPDGEVQLQMGDGGLIAVRANTKMRVAQYVANGDAGDKSVLGLLEGGLRSVSGWIAKFNPNGYQIRTSIATVGIRGTDHETQVRLRDDADGEAGVYDRVFAGGTFIRTPQGRVDVIPNRAGFSSVKPGARPKLLDRVPSFFRPTRNEGRIEGQHERIQKGLEKKRAQRQEQVRELQRKQKVRPPAAEQPKHAGEPQKKAAEKRAAPLKKKPRATNPKDTRKAKQDKESHEK